MSIKPLMRDNIANLEAYRCARDEFEGEARVYLDANENWRDYIGFNAINRYPDPHSALLRRAIEEVMGLPYENTIVGNGSDELIDLLYRIFCRPGKDSVLLLPPTYGAYKVFASINEVNVITLPLTKDFALDEEGIKSAIKKYAPKLLFICSPNNPTGNAMDREAIVRIAEYNRAITVVDEAYGDFSKTESVAAEVFKNERLVVLRTLSKCWALAGARVGIAVTSKELHETLYNVKYPYNLSLPAQKAALEVLSSAEKVRDGAREIIEERERLRLELEALPSVKKVFPSDANFLLVRIEDAEEKYEKLKGRGIITRLRSKELNCASCLRITVGSRVENDELLDALKEM